MPSAKQILRRFAEGLILESEKEVLEFLRGYIGKKLEKLTPEMLVKAIRNKEPLLVNPGDKEKFQRVMKRVMQNRIAKKLFNEHSKEVNGKMILRWWREDRLDLFSVVLNWPDREEALKYVDVEVERVKNDVFTPESVNK